MKVLGLLFITLLLIFAPGPAAAEKRPALAATLTATPALVAPGQFVQIDYCVANVSARTIKDVRVYAYIWSACGEDYLWEQNTYTDLRPGQEVAGAADVLIPDPPPCHEYYAQLGVVVGPSGVLGLREEIYVIEP